MDTEQLNTLTTEQLKSIIEDKLKTYNMANLDTYPSNTQQQLYKIEEYIQEIYSLRKKYEASKLNILSISNGAGIARQTIYNKPELEEYIELVEADQQNQVQTLWKNQFR